MFLQEDNTIGIQTSQEDDLTNLQEDKLGQLVWISKLDLSLGSPQHQFVLLDLLIENFQFYFDGGRM